MLRLFPEDSDRWRSTALRVAIIAFVFLVLPGGAILYTVHMPGWSHAGPIPPPTPAEQAMIPRQERTIQVLAHEIGPRNVRNARKLHAAERHITDELKALGLQVATQEIVVFDTPTHNVEVAFPGAALPDEIVLIGAHYDTVTLSPGADDNATGVAALLEIARALAAPDAPKLDRTVRLVFFVNEEAPFYKEEGMGSVAYARRSKARDEQIVGMLSLDMLGYYSDDSGSQRFPPIYRWEWRDAGDFILIMGGLRARPFVQQAVGLFRETTAMPCRGIAVAPEFAGSDRSDHWSFHLEGYPGAIVTDTGVSRNPHYHQLTDTLDTLDLNRLARVTSGLITVTQRLATE